MAGRPEKYTISYFPHYTKDSKSIFIIENIYGSEGYSFWFKLLELLCNSKNLFFDCNENGNIEYLSAKTKTTIDQAKNILDTLASIDCIDKELWNKGKIIWCQSLVDEVKDIYKKRKSNVPLKPVLNFRSGNSIKVDGKSISDVGNSISATGDKIREDKNRLYKKENIKERSKNKILFMDFVYLSKEEHKKLIKNLGANKTNTMIHRLNDYIGSKGNKYKSHYYTILNWVRMEIEKNKGSPKEGKKYKEV